MSLFSRFLGTNETRSDSLSFQDIWNSGAQVGTHVTTDSALQVSAVWSCIRLLSDQVATLPTDSFSRDTEGVRNPHPRPGWLTFKTGPWTKVDVIGQAMVSALVNGNAYIATYRDPQGKVLWLETLDPNQVEPFRVGAEIRYRVGPTRAVLTSLDILHIRGFTLPGDVEGQSPIHVARETIGLAIAANKFGSSFFENNATPGMVIEATGDIPEAAQKAMKASWNEMHRGAGNGNRLAIATNGAKFSKISLAPEDSQFLQTRQFQVSDIARVFGVPPSLIGHTDGPELGNSVSDKNTLFAQYTLRPWVERFETAFTWLITSEGGNPNAFIKIDLNGLMRGDHAARHVTYNTAVMNGIYTINEVRAFEDKPPVSWGDLPISVQTQLNEDAEPTERERLLEAAKVLQQTYLAAGKTITIEEARKLAGDIGGFDLPGGLDTLEEPEPEPPSGGTT